MLYEILVRVQAAGGSPALHCASAPVLSTAPPYAGGTPVNATVTVAGAREAWLTWVGGTEYDARAGDAAHAFSFRGADPHAALAAALDASTRTRAYTSERARHVADVQGVLGAFALDLLGDAGPAAADLAVPTDQLVAAYTVDDGNPYLEWLTFNYGRYMLASSARGSQPANLQGKWAMGAGNPWSAGVLRSRSGNVRILTRDVDSRRLP